MKKLATILLLFGLGVLPALAADDSYKNVSIIDSKCSAKAAADPDSHTRSCAIQCAMSGYGIITSDKKFIKFDDAGNKKVEEALKASDKKDHLRADVSGELNGDTLKVTSFKLL